MSSSRIVLAFACFMSPSGVMIALAGEVTAIKPPPSPSASLLLDKQAVPAWRQKTQLVWDADLQRLERKTFAFWDPYAPRALDLYWVPEDSASAKSGPVTGHGRLSWRKPGAASYEEDATLLQYEGEIKEGKATGYGELREAAGAYYRGEWKDGQMDGHGRLHFENGDEYLGTFKQGRLDGKGTYVYPTGEVYSGGFTTGLRDGEGHHELSNGHSYSAVWRKGEELAGSRSNERGPENVQLRSDDVYVGITADRRKLRDENAFADVMAYISESTPNGLRIFPDNQRLLDVWRGRADIQVTEQDQASVKLNRSFLGPPEQYKPVPLIFDVRNTSSKPLSIVGAYLAIDNSVGDMEPAVQIIGPTWGGCGGPSFWTSFQLENFGWSSLKNTKITGRFLADDGKEVIPPFSANIGTIAEKGRTDTLQTIIDAGLDVKRMKSVEFKCGKAVDEAMCLSLARGEGVFGKLSQAVRLNDVFFYVPMKSTLEYDWEDQFKVTHHKSSPFTVNLAVGTRELTLECGEGALPEARFRDPFMLRVDARNYRIPIPLEEDLPAGVTGRWRFQLDAPMSSSHSFSVVVQLSDGREVRSRQVDLLYFKPKPFPDRDFAAGDL